MNNRFTIPQVLCTAAIFATIMTIADWMVEWEKRIYAGLFAFLASLIAAKLSLMFMKGEHSNQSGEIEE